ncbi:S-layer family protein [Limnohabitans sp. G3-2]|uniref:beta strand repeat-containing protein n=1 Tax=Limnohabitans sp. G3-2 TaxID=1100711 RepID=UPI0026F41787|nr:YDG domain-containing protein [Limnohabitans sp. G3-2]
MNWTINPLASVTYTGTSGGLWSSGANWTVTGGATTGAAPTLGNVSAVVIPSGTTVAYSNAMASLAPTSAVAITNNGTINFTNTSAISIPATISGTGALNTSGAATTTLTAANTSFAGTATIDAGSTLKLGHANALGTASTVTVNGTLDLNSYSPTVSSVSGSTGTITNSAASTTSTLATGGDNSSTTYGGVIQNGVGTVALTKNGTGTVTLSGGNTYTGGTTISAGTLKMGHATALGGSGGAVSVASGAALDLNGTTMTNTNALTLRGTGISDGGALSNSSSTAGTYAGTVVLGSASSIGSAVGEITASGVISGAFALTKVGASSLTLTGSNSYSGGTTVAAGALKVGHENALGTAGGGGAISVFSGAALDLKGVFLNNANTLTLNGEGISSGGALTNSNSAGGRFQGLIVLGSDTSIGSSTGNMSLTNDISGSYGLTKVGAANITLGGTNTYSGTTTVSGGILAISLAQGLGTTAAGTSVATGARLLLPGGLNVGAEAITLNGGSLELQSGTTSLSGQVTLGANSSIRVDSGAQLTLSGLVSGTDRVLTKTSTGTLVLTGTNTYSGGTLVSAGTLQLGAGGATGSIEGNVTNNATLAFNRSDDLTFSGVISGTGAVTKSAANTLTMSGDNTYSGGTTINAGTLQVGDGSTNGAIAGNVTNNATLAFNRSDALNFSGAISGTGAVTKLGTGTTTLSGINTYTGSTTVSTGTLAIGNADGLGGTAAGTTVASGATLDLQGVSVGAEALVLNGGTLSTSTGTSSLSGTVTLGGNSTVSVAGTQLSLSGVVSGTGFGLTKTGTGSLVLSGTNTYSGANNINAGSVKAASGDALGTGAVAIGAAGVLDLTYSGTVSLGSTLSMSSGAAITNSANTSNLSIAGTSALVGNINTAGNQTYTGAVTLSGNTTLTTLNTSQANTNGAITFGGAVDGAASGAQSLTVTSGTGAVSFGSTVGNTAALSSITITGGATSTGQTTTLGGNVTTSGLQSFGGNLTLGTNTSLTSTANGGNGLVTIAGNVSTVSTISSGIIQFLGSGNWKYSPTDGSTWAYYSGNTYVAGSSTTTSAPSGLSFSISYSASTYTYTPTSTFTNAQILVVGGGAAGGSSNVPATGGGGGGGVVYVSSGTLSGTYSVVVGNGGSGGGGNGGSGGNSSLALASNPSGYVITANGGGGGAGSFGDSGLAGGSGGGGHWTTGNGGSATRGSVAGFTGATLSGNNGGASNRATTAGGGGGGASTAGAAGTTQSSGVGGNGGQGISYSITGSSVVYGSGGGGMGQTSSGVGGTNAGNAATYNGAGPGSGVVNTGGGGGGGFNAAGSGGSGVVVVSGNMTNIQGAYALTINSGSANASIGGSVVNITSLSVNSRATNNLLSGAIGGSTALSYNTAVGYAGSNGATGVLNLAGTNTYTGGTTVSGGTLQAGSTTAFGGASGAMTLNTGAVLDLNGKTLANANSLSLNGSGISGGGVLTNSSSTAAIYVGAVTLATDASMGGSGGDIAVSGVVRGASALTKTGSNTLTLSGNNNYSGATTVSEGTLAISHASGLGATAGGTTVASGATLDLRGVTVGAEALTLSGGTLTASTGTSSLSGAVNLTSATVFSGAGALTVSGAITSNDHGLALVGAGAKTLSSTSNTLSTIATGSGVGILNVANNQAMTIGQVTVGGSTYSGINATDTVSVVTRTGDLTVSQNVVTTSTATSYTTPALKLGAGSLTAAGTPTGGDVVLSGTPTISVGTGGVALIFSGYATTSAARTLTNSFAPKRSYYTTNADSTSVPTVVASAYFTLFRESPATLYTLYVPGQRSTYGTPVTSLNYCYSTSASSCAPVAVTGVPATTQALALNNVLLDAGTYPATISVPPPEVTGYFFQAGNAVNIVVDPKPVTIASTARTTTYNGLSTYTDLANATAYTVTGLVGYDAVSSVTRTPSGNGLVASHVANAGSFTVTPSTVVLSTGKASNYAFTYTPATATVNKADLTVKANNDAKFIGEADASGFGGVSYTGFVAGETASVLSGAATVARSNAAVGAAGTYAGVLSAAGSTLSSTNYNINYVPGSYTIVPADQLLIRLADTSTTYGTAPSYTVSSVQYKSSTGNAVVDLTNRASVNNAAFALTDGAGGNTALTLGPLLSTLSSAGQVAAGSYQVGASSVTNTSDNYGNTVNIVGALTVAPKTLTPEATFGLSKVYDGTTIMSSLGFGLTGVVGADAVRATGVGTYANANAGSTKAFTVAGISLGGTDAANYKLAANTISGANGVVTTAPLLITANNDTKTYDASAYAATAGVAYSGFVNGETVSDLGGTLAFGGTAIGAVNVGNYVITPSGQTSSNYAISFGDGSLYISPADVTVSATNVALTGTVGKVYDGTNVATLTSSNYLITGWQGSDGASITQTTGTYDNANAGTNKLVSVTLASSDFSATNGTLLSNYNLPTAVSGNVGVISPKTVTVTNTARSSVYDGTSYAALSLGTTYSVGTMVGPDAVASITQTPTGLTSTASGAAQAGTFTVTPGAAVLSTGADSNYNFSYVGSTHTVTPAPLSAALTGTSSKVYDGSTAAALTAGNFALTGFVNSESASVSKTSGTLDTANVGNSKTVTTTLGSSDFAANIGTQLSNYSLPTSASGSIGSVTPAPLAAALTGTSSKVYDGSTAATLTAGNFALSGFVNSEGASVTQTSGTLDTANVGTSKAVTAVLSSSDFAANSGTQLSNYTLPTSASGSIGSVTPAPLAAALTGTSSKVYDGSTAATLTAGNFALSGFVNSEGASVTQTSGTLETANVGTSKAVTAVLSSSDFAANSGTQLSNYTLPTSASGSIGSVTPAPLAAALTGTSSKVYDGSTAATLTAGNFALSGFVNSEGASVSQTAGTLDTANVGTSKAVTAALSSSDFAASSGTQLSNYSLPTSASGNVGSVTPAPLTVSATNASKTYDGMAYSGGNGVSYSGFVNSETAYVLGGTLNYTGTSQGARNAGSYVITPAGLSSSNYAVSFADGSLSVTPAPLTVTAVTNTKSFDGNTEAQAVPVVSGLKVSDTVVNLREAYADANPGTGKTLSVQMGYQIVDGNNGNNYVVSLVPSQTGEIRALPVAILAPTLAVVPTANSAPPTLTVLASSSAGASSAGSAGSAGGGSSAGVSVSTISSPTQQANGLVAVLVPAGTATAGSGLVIALPEQVLTPAASGAAVKVTLPNSEPLPAWIRYDAATQTLVTSAVPAGAFPLSVVVTVGGQSTVVQISEAQSNL